MLYSLEQFRAKFHALNGKMPTDVDWLSFCWMWPSQQRKYMKKIHAPRFTVTELLIHTIGASVILLACFLWVNGH